jgi:hypothetical protein
MHHRQAAPAKIPAVVPPGYRAVKWDAIDSRNGGLENTAHEGY